VLLGGIADHQLEVTSTKKTLVKIGVLLDQVSTKVDDLAETASANLTLFSNSDLPHKYLRTVRYRR